MCTSVHSILVGVALKLAAGSFASAVLFPVVMLVRVCFLLCDPPREDDIKKRVEDMEVTITGQIFQSIGDYASVDFSSSQVTVALSTAEAEYVAISAASRGLVWILCWPHSPPRRCSGRL